MSRPTKCRRVCRFPENLEFSTMEKQVSELIILTVDEYETIRLIDKEGLSQEECGTQLGLGRTTAQKIYETARRKLADALVLGRSLKIEGGEYYLCNGNSEFCYKRDCAKRQQIKASVFRVRGSDPAPQGVNDVLYLITLIIQHSLA